MEYVGVLPGCSHHVMFGGVGSEWQHCLVCLKCLNLNVQFKCCKKQQNKNLKCGGAELLCDAQRDVSAEMTYCAALTYNASTPLYKDKGRYFMVHSSAVEIYT